MCKHVLNAQVTIHPACCPGWFECQECHEEHADHEMVLTERVCLACLACKGVFWRNLNHFTAADHVCPHCNRQVVSPAVTPETRLRDEATAYCRDQLAAYVDAHRLVFKPDDKEEEVQDSHCLGERGLLLQERLRRAVPPPKPPTENKGVRQRRSAYDVTTAPDTAQPPAAK